MPEGVVLLQDEAIQVLSYWGLAPGSWRIVGFTTSSVEGVTRPIIEVGDQRYVLHRQPPDLTENDTLFRHAFMRHLNAAGLPVPPLLARPDGHTYAVPEGGIYEMQGWLDGQPFLTNGPGCDERLEAAAATLGLLHQTSADFQWQRHIWPEERSTPAIAQAYIGLIHQTSQREGLASTVSDRLARIATESSDRLDDAMDALSQTPGPPEIHIHGDYQAHNLAFGPSGVTAIYDFDAARWDRRIYELAYSLLYFTGVRWEETSGVTPPLVSDGLEIPYVQAFLNAYGREAPPAEGEARLLGDALTLVFPIVFANGVAEDLMFPQDFVQPPSEESAVERLQWASTFWLWLDRYRDMLAQTWEAGE